MPILINDNTARVQYTATAGQTVFIVPYEFFEVGDLKVYNGDTLLAYNTSPSSASQYSVTGAGVTGGGSITLGASGASISNVITIVRDIPIKRLTDFPNAGPFNVQALNTELDKLTAVQQNLETDLDNRVLRLGDSDTPNTLSAIPNKAARQNKLLGFDVQGQPTAYDAASLATLVAYATAYADTFTGDGTDTTFTLSGDPAVIANLDVSINGVTQVPLIDYTLSGTTLTTTTAVPNGAVMLVKFKEGLPNYSGDAQDIRYTAGFAGATAQTVQTKLEQYVSVKDFGAVGNNIANDTAAIQAAIDSLPSLGGAVYIPSGVYKVSGIYLDGTSGTKTGVTLFGDGRGSELFLISGSSGENVLAANSGNDFVVRGLTINGNVAGNPIPGSPTDPDYEKWNGIRLSGVERATVTECLIVNCGFGGVLPGAANLTDNPSQQIIINNNIMRDNSFGIGAMYQNGNVIENNVIVSNLTYGMVIDQFSSQCTINGNAVIGNGNNGIFGYRVDRCTFVGNVCRSNDGVGLVIDNGSVDNTIIGNACGDNTNSGIKVIGGAYSNTVSGNTCDTNGQYGVHIDGSGNNVVVGNTVRENIYSGIGVSSSPNTIVNDNNCYLNEGSGVYAENSNLGLCSGNICLNNNQFGNVNDSGIRLVGTSSAWSIVGNKCFDDQGVKTQNYGIRTEGSASAQFITNNAVSANLTAGMSLANTNTVRQNTGWVTENNGTATVLSGSTTILVNHGLSATPSVEDISVTAISTLNSAAFFWVNNVTSTQFVINLNVNPAANVNFAWQAQIL